MRILKLLTLILFVQVANAQHSIWDELLDKHISNEGMVDYSGFVNQKEKLDTYLNYLSNETPENYTSEAEKKAFWINSYNAFCVKLVLNHYPIKSILEVKNDSIDVWDFPIATINNKTYSLNQIEHDIIRKQWKDPRIHAALISASVSCPKFPKKAFTKQNLDEQLGQLMFDFINDPKRNVISENTIAISEKFNWFKSDFTADESFQEFLSTYSVNEVNPFAKIKYLPYNWSLNDAKLDNSLDQIKQQLYAVHQTYDLLLKRYVLKNGNVDYVHFYDKKERLQKYLNVLASLDITNKWTPNERKALWLNAYNAYTMKLVMDNYPIKSIEKVKINGLSAWDVPFANVGGKLYSLNQIEHDILRKQFDDPRIHVGLNCASISCPLMLRTAYTATNVDSLLEKEMKRFVNDPYRNRVSEKTLELSQIFNWYKDDFTKKSSLIDYLNKYSNIKISDKAEVSYIDYNWGLNGI